MNRASISQRVQAIAVGSETPPWYVRLFGGIIVLGDLYIWLVEGGPVVILELVKHGIILLIGLRLFYPEAARWVASQGKALYSHRRSTDK